MNDFFENHNQTHGLKKKWLSISSELEDVNENKKDIKIEIRPEKELLEYQGIRLTPYGVKGYYPAFDITPNSLITKHIYFGTRKLYLYPDSYDAGKFSTTIYPHSSGSAQNLPNLLPEGQILLDK
jgi:hypothetical protein